MCCGSCPGCGKRWGIGRFSGRSTSLPMTGGWRRRLRPWLDAFLSLVKASGLSSWTLLQNIAPTGAVKEQAMAVALAVAERALKGRGACRVHGGGFAGTIQAFVPLELLDGFREQVESVLGTGSCHVLRLRPVGGVVLWS